MLRHALQGATLLSALLTVAAYAEAGFPGLERLMTQEEFASAGLEKLSVEEREALNRWIASYTGQEVQQVKDDVETGQYEKTRLIQSRILGEFGGWDGKTVFQLENGQTWVQRLPGRWQTSMVDPEVVIEANFFGFYYLEVIGTGKKIGVKRLADQ